MNYDITIWDLIRFRVQHTTSTLVEEINKEISKDYSLREFWGEYPVRWQLREAIQQRADSWIQRLYDLSRDAYKLHGMEASAEFDRAMWAYHVEPFISMEVANNHGYQASRLMELLLCAVGSAPDKRNLLKVGQKDCCLSVKATIYKVWSVKLHHWPTINKGHAVTISSNTVDVRTAPIAGEPPLRPNTIENQVGNLLQIPNPLVPQSPHELNDQAPPAQGSLNPEVRVSADPLPPQLSVETPETTWNNIEISFLSDERVQIRDGTTTETRNYGDFGFEDRRNGKPNRAWVMLRALAEKGGVIPNPTKRDQRWSLVEKRIQEIRKVLRAHFNISTDPIPFVKTVGYQVRFKIGCRPCFDA
jgi:hypothetical protein